MWGWSVRYRLSRDAAFCCVLILGNIQKPTRYGPQKTALVSSALSWQFGLELQRFLLTSGFFQSLPTLSIYMGYQRAAIVQFFTLLSFHYLPSQLPYSALWCYTTVMCKDERVWSGLHLHCSTVVETQQMPMQNKKNVLLLMSCYNRMMDEIVFQ